MILLDTCTLIFDSLTPERLSIKAQQAIEEAERETNLHYADISIWEIAMLISKGRLDPGCDALTFLRTVVAARSLTLLPITPEIADLSTKLDLPHNDPADRLIAATAVHHGALLLTLDNALLQAPEVRTLW